MILVHLLFILVVLIALIFQLVTPLVLNIPVIALSLAVLIFTIWSFRRMRRKGKFPFVASLALAIQSVLFILSIAILVVVTIPHESPEDSPAVVQGIRRFLVSQGLIDKPRTLAPPILSGSAEKKIPETLNAPDATKIQIKIDGDEGAPAKTEEKPKKEEEKKPQL